MRLGRWYKLALLVMTGAMLFQAGTACTTGVLNAVNTSFIPALFTALAGSNTSSTGGTGATTGSTSAGNAYTAVGNAIHSVDSGLLQTTTTTNAPSSQTGTGT